MKTPLTPALVKFFQAEVDFEHIDETGMTRNGQEGPGGENPATLQSALETLGRVPDETAIELANDPSVVDEEGVNRLYKSVQALKDELGGQTRLSELLAQQAN